MGVARRRWKCQFTAVARLAARDFVSSCGDALLFGESCRVGTAVRHSWLFLVRVIDGKVRCHRRLVCGYQLWTSAWPRHKRLPPKNLCNVGRKLSPLHGGWEIRKTVRVLSHIFTLSTATRVWICGAEAAGRFVL